MTREQVDAYIEENAGDVCELIDEIAIQDILYGYDDEKEILERLNNEIEHCRKFANGQST